MRTNKYGDLTPFDMKKAPIAQRPYLLPLVWGASFLMTRKFHLTIRRVGMKEIRPPFLMLSTHQGCSDYYIAPLALFPHRANYVSDMEGFAAFGERLYRAVGCIGKRRYVADAAVLRNIQTALKHRQSVVVFPESRHANVGTTALLPENLGRLAKHLGVPLVILSVHGSYLANPFWDESHTRRVPMEATLRCLYTAQALRETDAQTVQDAIAQALTYDEYAWQRENQIVIDDPNRARGLELPLYQCRACETEFEMEGSGTTLRCKACGATWELDPYGSLRRGAQTEAIPAWYEWERQNAQTEFTAHPTPYFFSVRVEALANAKGFVPIGKGVLTLDASGFTLEIGGQSLFFAHAARESVQTEYNYRENGPCIVLSTRDCCYYLYGKDPAFSPTWLQFVGEFCHNQSRVRREAVL